MANRTASTRLLTSIYRTHLLQRQQASRAFTTTHTRQGVDQTTNPAAVHMSNLPHRSIKPRRRSSSPTLPTNSTAELAYPYTDPASATSEELLDDDDRSFSQGRTASSVEDTTYFRITLRRSAIGLPGRIAAVLSTLGLHRRGLTVYHPVTPDVVGKLMRVKELIAVEEVPFDKLPPGADEIVRLTHFTDAPLPSRSRNAAIPSASSSKGPRALLPRRPNITKTELKARLAEIMARHLGTPSFPGGSALQTLDAESAEMVNIWVADAQALDRHAPPVLGPARLIAKLEEAHTLRRRSADVGFFVERRAGDALKQ